MKTVCKKSLDVFEFEEEVEVSELARRIMSKLENPRNDIGGYTFVETEGFPQSSVDKLEARTMTNSDVVVNVVKQLPQSSLEPKMDLSGSEVTASALPCNKKPNLHELHEMVNMDQDEHQSMLARSSSTCSDIAENDGDFAEPSSDHCTGGWKMDDEDITDVVLYPDHMMYRENYCTDSVLTFTSSYIKVEGSTSDEEYKTFEFQWGIEDILNIQSYWYELFEMAMVTIHVLTKDTAQAEDLECTSGDELKFAVIDDNWYGRQEAIASLNAMYKALWTSGGTSDGLTCEPLMRYFPNFDLPFEEVVYPKGDADAVSISKRDVDLLQPDTFVNDTIIDFYIKYLKNNINPEDRHRFHFFNSFFFRKLADPDKDPLNASQGRAGYQRVRKWTRKVNLFEKDYVFIPVNYNYHWSLIVMCHLGEMATYKDVDVDELVKVPCVLHMDSIRGSHTGLKGLMQSYSKEEWKGRHPDASEDIASRFDNLRFISLELPQQQNSSDCGLFLLHYVELFLEQAPVNFNPFKITESMNFLNLDWFPPAEASLKRGVIQRLIYDLLDQASQEPPSADGNHETHEATAVNILSDECQSLQAAEEIEVSLLPLSSSTSRQFTVASKLPFESGSFLGMKFPDFNQTSFDENKSPLSPIQEDAEGGDFVYPPATTEIGAQEGRGIAPNDSSPWNPPPFSDHNPGNNHSETSVSGCQDPLQIVDGNGVIDVQLVFQEPTDEPTDPIVANTNANGDDDDVTFSMDILPGLSSRDPDMHCDGPTSSDGSSGPDSGVHRPAKKMRTSEPALQGPA